MSHEVDVLVDPGVAVDGPALGQRAARMLEAAELDDAAELSLRLTGDAAIRALNARWRGRDAATDVLSFPLQAPPVAAGPLGDVVISVDTAAAQASEHGHELGTELAVLLAHGIAHLLGHDHEVPVQARAMALVEARLLAAVGVSEGLVERAGAGG